MEFNTDEDPNENKDDNVTGNLRGIRATIGVIYKVVFY